jgi:hypothetical protein
MAVIFSTKTDTLNYLDNGESLLKCPGAKGKVKI